MKQFDYIDAATVDEAAKAKANGADIIAGGTDLLGVLKKRILPEYPAEVVNLKSVQGLDGIERTETGVRIGANARLADIAENETVKALCPGFAEAAGSVASRLIRSQATLGGNMCQDVRCWYYRYPNQLGGRIDCARKDGTRCYAFTGENKFHSIFGGMRVHRTGCSDRCPGHIDIPDYLEKLRAGDIDGACEILMRKNPIPAITSRVCSHFCMMGCVRSQYDEEVNIGQIERYLGDYILAHKDKFMPAPEHEMGRSVGIVGAGPAALSAAFYLRKKGYAVTVIDRMPEPGGLLMYAIPEYRIPKDKVREVVRAIADMGVVFKTNVHVGDDVQLEDIIAQYDSVFLDTGAWKRNIIGIDGEELTQFGLEFLVEVKSWMRDKSGSDVVVVAAATSRSTWRSRQAGSALRMSPWCRWRRRQICPPRLRSLSARRTRTSSTSAAGARRRYCARAARSRVCALKSAHACATRRAASPLSTTRTTPWTSSATPSFSPSGSR